MLMMLTVMFALYSIFDMSLRVFSFGNDKTEAVQNARLGMEKMEREIRAAYPVDKGNDEDHLFFVSGDPSNESFPGDQTITFGHDLDGDRLVSCPNTEGDCEYITYRLSGASPPALLRNNTVTGSNSDDGGDPVIEYVNGASGLEFTYLDEEGDPCASSNPDCTGTDESQIEMVRIRLEIEAQRGPRAGTQTLTTDVALRNRSSQ